MFSVYNYNNQEFVAANNTQRDKAGIFGEVANLYRAKKIELAANQAVLSNLINSLTQRKQRGVFAFIPRIKLPINKIRKGIRNLSLLQ